MAGRQANKKLALRITDRCLRLPAVRLPAPARSGQWRRVARLRMTFTASFPTLSFFWVWGFTSLADTFTFLKPLFYRLLQSLFHCLSVLRFFIAGYLTSFLLADGTAFHCVTCPAIRPFSFYLYPCSRSVPAGAFSLTYAPLHSAFGSLRRHPPVMLRYRLFFVLFFLFSFLPALLVMANRLRIPLRSMPNLSPAPCLFPFLFTLRAGQCLLRDRRCIAFRFRFAQAAPAGSSSLPVIFFPFLQVFLRQFFPCPISLSCYCGWSAIPLRSMTYQPQAFVSLTSWFSFSDGGCLIRSLCSIAFRIRSLIRNPPLMLRISHIFFQKNLLLIDTLSVLPWSVYRDMYLHTISYNF
jgi:hypothetical protein